MVGTEWSKRKSRIEYRGKETIATREATYLVKIHFAGIWSETGNPANGHRRSPDKRINARLFFAADCGRLVPYAALIGGEEIGGTAPRGAPEADTRSQGAPSGATTGQVTDETGYDNQTRPVLYADHPERREVVPNVVLGELIRRFHCIKELFISRLRIFIQGRPAYFGPLLYYFLLREHKTLQKANKNKKKTSIVCRFYRLLCRSKKYLITKIFLKN